MTIKNLSTTRWECRIDSVKCDRFTQMERFLALYGFFCSVDNMKKAVQDVTLGLGCRNMEIKTEDLVGQNSELVI